MFQKKQPARIFINYRRDDTRWVSGRLIDSLRAYFGDDRVFRDIESIKAGAEFGDVINLSMQSADAVIVLIGRDWLTVTGEDGQPRLEDPQDWVAREIASALAKGVPVYPVLVENTPIPRPEDLPEPIRPLVERNAMSISEQRWEEDVTRLAKIVGIDVPGSAAERILDRVRLIVSLLLLASIVMTTGILVWNTIAEIPEIARVADVDEKPDHIVTVGKEMVEVGNDIMKIGKELMAADKDDPASDDPTSQWMVTALFSGTSKSTTDTKEPKLLKLWQASITYVAILASSILLLVFAKLFDESRRIYAQASGLVGAIGTLVAWALLLPLWPNAAEPLALYFGSTVIATTMFVLMNLSGFKAK